MCHCTSENREFLGCAIAHHSSMRSPSSGARSRDPLASPRNDGDELTEPTKPQISRPAAFTFGFAAISCHRVIRPRFAPVGRTLGGPDEIGRACKMRQSPCAIIADVADEAKFAAWL